MANDAVSVLVDIERIYDSASGEVTFLSLVSQGDGRDDETLAELIEADGRLRMARGKPVDLKRYLAALPDLYERPLSLDAAVDVALRALSGGANATPAAVERLVADHPQAETVIREAAALNRAVVSTSGLHEQMQTQFPVKEVPYEFGPLMPDGESRYVLQKLLGRGAFGQVYLALDRQLSEEGHTALVAIKILVIGTHSPFARDRLIEEATKVRRISHPNVVQVIDRGVSDQNEDYIVYEYVDGGDLGNAWAARPRWPVREAVELVRKIALGVHAAHSAGVIHCDLKPGNIMLTSKGDPKVADFGVAVRFGENRRALLDQHGSAGAMIGNLAFISPEQYRNEPNALSVPSDVYALGGILYMLLTGQLPNGSTVHDIAKTHEADRGRSVAPPLRGLRAEVDRDLERICQRALAPRAEDRYHSSAALAEDLGRWHRQEPIYWTKPSLPRLLALWSRRKPALATSLLVLVAVTVVGVAVAWQLHSTAERQRYEKALAELEMKVQKEREVDRVKIGHDIMNKLRASQNQGMNIQALNILHFVEYLYGPRVFGVADIVADTWRKRVEFARAQLNLLEAQGHAEHLDGLMWQSVLAFWLVCEGRAEEARELLVENQVRWRKVLAHDDPWLRDLKVIADCAEMSYHIQASEEGSNAEDLAILESVRQSLDDSGKRLETDAKGSPIHVLVLRTMSQFYQSSLGHEPQRALEIDEQVKLLLGGRQVDRDADPNRTRVKSVRKDSKPGDDKPKE